MEWIRRIKLIGLIDWLLPAALLAAALLAADAGPELAPGQQPAGKVTLALATKGR